MEELTIKISKNDDGSYEVSLWSGSNGQMDTETHCVTKSEVVRKDLTNMIDVLLK